jgi:ATP-binding cassette, subfamily C, bacterial CydCD
MNRRLFELARDSRLTLLVTILAGFLAGLLTIGQAALLSQVIQRVFLAGLALPGLLGSLRLILLIVFLRACLAWGSEVSANRLAVRVKSDLRRRLFDKILRLGPAYTRGERTGELTNTAVDGIEALDAWFSQYLPQLVIAALVPLSILVVVFPRDPLSGLILFLTAPLIPVFMYLIGKTAEALTRRQWDTLSRLSAHFFDSLQGLRTLKELGCSRAQANSIAESSNRFRDITLGVLRVTFLSALVLELVSTVSTALVAVEVGLRLLAGHLEFQPALFLLLLAPEFYLPLRMLGLRFHAGMSGITAARRIFEVLDTPVPAGLASGSQGSVPGEQLPASRPARAAPVISIDHLFYTYPSESEPVLQDISLKIQTGEHIALVGSSGAGKSSLAALLLRFMDPGSGSLALDQKNSAEIPLEGWRSFFTWVPQDPHLFHATLAVNLRLAKPDASDDELQTAVRLAHLDDFVQSLPDGYETVIGEEGARLSAGQAQRLSLARAFLKDAPILVLDEPTSNLDPEQERLIETSLGLLRPDQTLITIAHRLNTVFQADRILVLEGGRIVESGNHADLLALNGAYAALVNGSARGNDQTSSAGGDRKDKLKGGGTDLNALPGVSGSPLEPCASQPDSNLIQRSPIIPRLLSFLKGSWSWVTLSVLLGVLTVGSNVGLMGTSAFLISAAALHPEIGTLQVAIVSVRFFGIARAGFRYAERLSTHNVTFRLLARLRTWFYRALEPLAPARLMEYRSGDLLGRIVSDVAALEDFYVRVVSPSLVALLVGAGMTFFFSRYDARLAWSYLGFTLLLGVGVPLLASRLSRRTGTQLISQRADMQAGLVDGIQGLADLLAFGQGAAYASRLQEQGRLYGKTQRRLAGLTGLSIALTVLLVNLGTLVVLVLAVPLVRSGQLPGVMLAVLGLAASAGFEGVLPLPQAAQSLSSSLQAARRLFQVVDAEPAVVEEPQADLAKKGLEGKNWPDGPVSGSAPQYPLTGIQFSSLSLRSVSFTYPGSNLAALEKINFDLTLGKRLAIVGPSGAGKSTLTSLLLRFWEIAPGQIWLNGHDLRDYPPADVRKLFSVVSQQTWFLNDTVRRNLLLACPHATETGMQEAARRAQIHEFICGLPRGYDTIIGERGYRLSGGERQRLAIARLLLKDAPILLLDEPTADLDTLTEGRILADLFSLANTHTLIWITHRLVGLAAMDEILVLDHGRIAQRGTHTGLLAQDGLYRTLYDLQSRVLK